MRAAQQRAPAGAPGVASTPSSSRGATTGAFAWAVVGALVFIGAVLRLITANQPLFGDELSTYWVITRHELFDMLSVVHGNAELTPPLYFILSWSTAHAGHTEELVRAPSLLAGVATIPLVYALGVFTVGRPAALLASALTAFSPFMIYYSAEARAYGVMMFFVVVSTLALVRAVDGGRTAWWIVYGCSSCLAMYSHYMAVFVLVTQFVWAMWAHPEARRPAILANLGALVLFLPWITGVRNDFTSPTSGILSLLSPFSAHSMKSYLAHWVAGHPYSYVPLGGIPGAVALTLLGLSLLIGAAGWAHDLIRRLRMGGRMRLEGRDGRVLLVVALALAGPIGTVAVSAVSNNIVSVRNMAASWPPLALSLAALAVGSGPRRLRYAAGGLMVLAFVIAGTKMLDGDAVRPDHRATADFIERVAEPGDVVIDGTGVISPGPLSTFDTTVRSSIPLFRAGVPAQRDHPFNFQDPIVSIDQAFRQASSAAPGKRIFFVRTEAPDTPGYAEREQAVRGGGSTVGYRRVSGRIFPGFVKAQVEIFEPAR